MTAHHTRNNEMIQARTNEMMELAQNVQDEMVRNYLISRLIPRIQLFKLNSRVCKRKYMNWSVASLSISASIPVVSVIPGDGLPVKLLIAALGSLVTFISGYLMLHDSRSRANSFCLTAEDLTRTVYQYFTETGPFKDMEQKERNACLVEICEAIMEKQHENLHKESGENADAEP